MFEDEMSMDSMVANPLTKSEAMEAFLKEEKTPGELRQQVDEQALEIDRLKHALEEALKNDHNGTENVTETQLASEFKLTTRHTLSFS